MKRAWRLEQWILAVTIPALVVVALVLGVAVYRGLYQRVLDGFDRKLLAATGTVAAFIDGDDHQALLRPLPMRALAWDAAQSRLLGEDTARQVYVVDTSPAKPIRSPTEPAARPGVCSRPTIRAAFRQNWTAGRSGSNRQGSGMSHGSTDFSIGGQKIIRPATTPNDSRNP